VHILSIWCVSGLEMWLKPSPPPPPQQQQ
jgi:hypothetical protein